MDRRTFIFSATAALTGLFIKKPARANGDLGGRAFSDPDEITPMPDNWHTRRLERPPGTDLALAIDQQLFPAIRPLVVDFAHRHGLKVALQEGTCGIASSALASRTADITGMCCPPGPLDRMPGVSYHTIGIAALALIVHPSNPLDGVSLTQARRLFGGNATTWSDLPASGTGRMGERVHATTRLHCVTRPGHWRLLLGREADFAARAIDVPAIADMIMQVASDPSAIGYETLWHVQDNARRGKVKPLRLDGRHPTDNGALAAGRYPLFRTFSVTSWTQAPAAQPAAQALVRHLVEHAGDLDPQFGIVPAAQMRAAGWRFKGDEVVGRPG